MSTSKGQCCQVCYTTRSYLDNGKHLWSKNFGTDTIDMYVYSGDCHLVGDDELIFSYLDEFTITNSGNNKEHYVLPALTHIFNHSNFGSYHKDGKFNERSKLEEFESNKEIPYIQSYEFHQNMSGSPTPLARQISNHYSYPLGLNSYNRASNSKEARVFVNQSGINIVKPNNIYHYELTGNQHRLKHIAFIGNNYNLASYNDNKIYCGGEKYCHNVIEFIERFKYISGTPDGISRERLNIIFNYEPNESGILYNSGIINNFSLIYYDKNYRYDLLDFSFYKDSGIVWLGTDTPYCTYKQFLAEPRNIYKGRFQLIKYENDYNEDIPSWLQIPNSYISNYWNHHFYHLPTAICDSGTDLDWRINNYSVDTVKGEIKIELEKIYNLSIDSGTFYYRYDQSIVDGFNYTVSGTGLINGYWSYYSPEIKRSEIVQFNTNTINSTNVIYKDKNWYNSLNSSFVLNSEWGESGSISNNGLSYGYWKLNPYQQGNYLFDKMLTVTRSFLAETSGGYLLDEARASGYMTIREPYILSRYGFSASIISGTCFNPYGGTGQLVYRCPVPWVHSGFNVSPPQPAVDGYTLYTTNQVSKIDFSFNMGNIIGASSYINGEYVSYEVIVPGTGECNQIVWSYSSSGYEDIYIPNELVGGGLDFSSQLCLTNKVNSGDKTAAFVSDYCCMQSCFGEGCYYACRYPIIFQFGEWYGSCSGNWPTCIAYELGISQYRIESVYGTYPVIYPIQYVPLGSDFYFLPVGIYPTANSGLVSFTRNGDWGITAPDVNYGLNGNMVGGSLRDNSYIGFFKNNNLNIFNKDINYD